MAGTQKPATLRALLGAALASLALPGAGADIRFGNVLPGGGPVQKSVLSMREARYVHLVEQHTDFSCGAAALATILNYAYGKNLTEFEVIQEMLEVSDPETVREKGFSLLDMKRYVETLGMRGRGYEVAPDTLERIKIPVIVLLDIKGYKHFVVLKKAAGNRAYLGDPALGNRVMEKEEFLRSWNGIVFAVIGQGFIRDTVLINPPEPLTAKRLREVHATTLTNAQLLEFGFRHADLF
ncbi:MAG: peptidase C39 [Azospira oryzae]|nr:MAG: peptidase C39 [Azospira oryzae]PZP79985.1 MAG: peptidase C39 [Azospira oryzae]